MALLDVMALKKLRGLVRRYGGIDISGYKDDFLLRRARARMLSVGVKSINEYVLYIERNPEEVFRFLDSMSINVSEFFRDPWVWSELRKYLKDLLMKESRVIRIWSAGCSRGEEPYTISILLHELLGSRISNYLITIYATDIDAEALNDARRGVYNSNSIRNVPLQLLSKYFVKLGSNTYAVKDNVKRIVKFYRHDLIRDPPLPLMDMIFCRNVLIYFSKDMQRKVILKFYNSLRSGGYLILGASEYLPEGLQKHFRPVNPKARIFIKM